MDVRPKRLGLIVPSSNIVAEPETLRILPPDGPITVHVSRLRVVRISQEQGSLGQFRQEAMGEAASLLADAKVDLIAWNGTAASWLGFDWDLALVADIEARTGIPATTSVIAVNKALHQLQAARIGLVTPYIAELEGRIARNYGRIGIEVVAAERLDLTENTSFAAVPPCRIEKMVESVSRARPDAVVIMCTNLAGSSIAPSAARRLGIPVLDSVRATAEHCLRRLSAEC